MLPLDAYYVLVQPLRLLIVGLLQFLNYRTILYFVPTDFGPINQFVLLFIYFRVLNVSADFDYKALQRAFESLGNHGASLFKKIVMPLLHCVVQKLRAMHFAGNRQCHKRDPCCSQSKTSA